MAFKEQRAVRERGFSETSHTHVGPGDVAAAQAASCLGLRANRSSAT